MACLHFQNSSVWTEGNGQFRFLLSWIRDLHENSHRIKFASSTSSKSMAKYQPTYYQNNPALSCLMTVNQSINILFYVCSQQGDIRHLMTASFMEASFSSFELLPTLTRGRQTIHQQNKELFSPCYLKLSASRQRRFFLFVCHIFQESITVLDRRQSAIHQHNINCVVLFYDSRFVEDRRGWMALKVAVRVEAL